MTFNEKLRMLCGKHNLTQLALTEAMQGPTKAAIWRWFNGREPSLSEAAKLANVLGVSLDYLGDDNRDYPNEDEITLPGTKSEQFALKAVIRQIGPEEALNRLALDHAGAVFHSG